MFNFNGINFESIKLNLRSLVGRFFTYHKEDNRRDERTLNLTQSKTHIEKQIVVNLPNLSENQQQKLLAGVMGTEDETLKLESTEAQSDSPLPLSEPDRSTENFLKNRVDEYKINNNLLLDRGALLMVYKERENLSFTKEDLIFLTQSSLKHTFPIWFWSFYYREHFENVTPLFQQSYNHPSSLVRKAVVKAYSDFSDTGDDIVKLAQGEQVPDVLGFIASLFLEKDNLERAQVVIANALTRKIIPILADNGKKKSGKARIDLGVAEKRILYKEVENGWAEEKIQALKLLAVCVDESDLSSVEKLLDKPTYGTMTDLIFSCVGMVGRTSKAEIIEKELLETRRIETFYSALDALVVVKYKPLFPKLLEWLNNAERITSRVWGEVDERKVEEKIQEAISALLDEETYEQLVNYILGKYSPDKHGNVMSWRHFWVLRENKKKENIRELLKKETRLKDFETWEDITSEVELEEVLNTRDKEKLLSLVNPNNFHRNIFILRRAYESITPEETLLKVGSIIENLRENLTQRLKDITSSEHSDEIKEIAKNGLDNFLGENRHFYRIYRKRKGAKETEEKDVIFEKLSEDISNFDITEKEYLAHIFKAKTQESRDVVVKNLGRPYESIYENVDKSIIDIETFKSSLNTIIESHPNPLVKLDAIEAAQRTEIADKQELRLKVLLIMAEARKKTKVSGGMDRGNDEWFKDEIVYIWAVNTLSEFGEADDFGWIEEYVNREKIIARNYQRYTYFFDNDVLERLLELSESLEDKEERDNAVSALMSLDYKWTKKILKVES